MTSIASTPSEKKRVVSPTTSEKKWVAKTDVIRLKYIDVFESLLNNIIDIFNRKGIRGVFFGGVVRDYFTSQRIPNDIDVAVNNIDCFLTELKNVVGTLLFRMHTELFDDYTDKDAQGRRITIESLFKMSKERLTLHLDVIPLDFLMKSLSDFDVNCLLYLPSHSIGIFHLKSRHIGNVLQNIQLKRFRFVKNLAKMDAPIDNGSFTHAFLVNLKLIQRCFKLIDSGWSCMDSLNFLDQLPFAISLKSGIPHCSVCLGDIEKQHHVKCHHCENYLCLKCTFSFAKKQLIQCQSSHEPACYLCRRDFFNLKIFKEFNPPVFYQEDKKSSGKFFKSTAL